MASPTPHSAPAGSPAPLLWQDGRPATPLSHELDGRQQGGSLAARGGGRCGPVRCPCIRVAGGPGTPRLSPSAQACPWLSTGIPAQGSKSEISPEPTSDAGSQLPLRGPLAKILKHVSCWELQTVPGLGLTPSAALWLCPPGPPGPPGPAGEVLMLSAAEVLLCIYSYIPNGPLGKGPGAAEGLPDGERGHCACPVSEEGQSGDHAGRVPPCTECLLL